jgi:hypothetical protein
MKKYIAPEEKWKIELKSSNWTCLLTAPVHQSCDQIKPACIFHQ